MCRPHGRVNEAPKNPLGGKMKQLGMLVVVVVGALIGSVAWGQQPLKAAGQDAKPWVLHDQNELSGVAVDLTRAVSKQIGVPIEYQPMVFADLIPAVDSGKIDIIATNMAITPEREQKVDFTSPYYNALPEARSCNRATQQLTDSCRPEGPARGRAERQHPTSLTPENQGVSRKSKSTTARRMLGRL